MRPFGPASTRTRMSNACVTRLALCCHELGSSNNNTTNNNTNDASRAPSFHPTLLRALLCHIQHFLTVVASVQPPP
jgi:hypothetical protein